MAGDAVQARLLERNRALEAERDRLAEDNAELRGRLEAEQHYSKVAGRIAEQTSAIEGLAERVDQLRAAGLGDAAPAAAAEPSAGGGPDALVTDDDDGQSPAQLRAELNDSRRRLRQLIDQFAAAHVLRLHAEEQADLARGQVANLNAQLQQQELVVQEAQLRAEKAEKLHAALEEAHARVITDNEKLSQELTTARERLAAALQQVVTLDGRLAAAEARVTQLQGETQALMEQESQAVVPDPVEEDSDADRQVIDVPAMTSSADEPDDLVGGAVKPAVYLVRADDTLSRISDKVYGDASAWRRIYDANRDVLATPDELAPGMTLVIP
jgi:LysM repeat protein